MKNTCVTSPRESPDSFKILLKATSKELSCLQVMFHRAAPYSDKQ